MKAFLTLAVLLALGSVAFADNLKTIDSFDPAAGENGALAYFEKDAQTGPSRQDH